MRRSRTLWALPEGRSSIRWNELWLGRIGDIKNHEPVRPIKTRAHHVANAALHAYLECISPTVQIGVADQTDILGLLWPRPSEVAGIFSLWPGLFKIRFGHIYDSHFQGAPSLDDTVFRLDQQSCTTANGKDQIRSQFGNHGSIFGFKENVQMIAREIDPAHPGVH